MEPFRELNDFDIMAASIAECLALLVGNSFEHIPGHVVQVDKDSYIQFVIKQQRLIDWVKGHAESQRMYDSQPDDSRDWLKPEDNPVNPGWYATVNTDYSVVPRYYDDSDDSWWISSNNDKGLEPNNSFIAWRNLPKYEK